MTDANVSAIGKYRIIELVGEGAMGVVYKAVDSVLDRTVAIKVMNESIARQEDLRKRFLHEAQAAASLQHPNVVCIYDLGEVDGHLFIAMEFVQGVDLEKLIELGEPLSLQARLDIVIDVLTGLTFAHKRGIVHRDIKPANIRVAEDGRAKIMDFGVAHLASSSMTRTGSFLGTPGYMAPEQITEGSTTPATDIFAVGGVLYQLLTQMKPFDAPTLQNLFFKIITEKPRPVSELMPGLPPALDRIVQKAMAKEPSGRYSSALDMANDLSAVRAQLSGPSYPASISLSASVASAIEQSRKVKDTRTRRLAYAGGAALAAGAVIVFALSRSSHPAAAELEAANKVAPMTAPATRQVDRIETPAPIPAASTAAIQPRSVTQRSAGSDKSIDPKRDHRALSTNKTASQSAPLRVATSAAPLVTAPVPSRDTHQQVVTAAPPPVVVARTAVATPAQESPPPVAPAPTAGDVAPTVEAYARAIESKDIGAIRQVYPGLTADQQQHLEEFFQSARSINVTLRIANFEPSGTAAANARLIGSYDYVTRDGKTERLPVNSAAILRHEGSAWKLVSVR